jgi:hypothetical protein
MVKLSESRHGALTPHIIAGINEWRGVGTVLTFRAEKEGTVLTFRAEKEGTVLTFRAEKGVGTVLTF